jgi:type II secretory ATPase GspE/PulE/Tfp pilus assembly ATPase PilB-like protein
VAVMEVLVINDDIRQAISSHKSEKEILEIAYKNGFITMFQD